MRFIPLPKLVSIFVLVILISACATATPTPDPEVLLADYDQTLSLYNQLQVGMTYDEAKALLGTPVSLETAEGQPPASNPVPQFPGLTWEFFTDRPGTYGLGGSIAYVVSGESGTGFKLFHWERSDQVYSQDALSTPEKYETIQEGMTYDQVKSLMGSPGRLISAQEQLLSGVPKIEVSGLKITSTDTWNSRLTATYAWWPESSSSFDKTFMVNFTNGVVSFKLFGPGANSK
jgi:outer membrane protein assembly factor BamE (lipoprotein component of BamABCDE complex)